jgi:hypothetical protein
MGGPLLAFWLAVVPDQEPEGVPDKATSQSKRSVGMLQLLGSSATWAIIIVNIVNHWGYFIYLNWMPSYFYQTLGLDLKVLSMFFDTLGLDTRCSPCFFETLGLDLKVLSKSKLFDTLGLDLKVLSMCFETLGFDLKVLSKSK